jgi:uncharacterized glyoxalase superfamily protein PhnB
MAAKHEICPQSAGTSAGLDSRNPGVRIAAALTSRRTLVWEMFQMNSDSKSAPARQVLGIAPYFLVRDVVKAAEYYRDALGFRFDRYWGEPPCFCMPRRDGVTVMLSQVDDASIVRPNSKAREDSWDAYVWVKDADAIFAEVQKRGAIIAYGPCLQEEYGNREFGVRDLDGYLLAFGSDASS